MVGKNFLTDHKLVKLLDAQGSGGSLVSSASLFVGPYEGVAFFGSIGTANPGNFAKLTQSDDNVTFADVEGTARTASANGNVFIIEVFQPTADYMKVEIVRAGAATTTGELWAVLYSGRRKPAVQPATVDTLQLLSPEEGAP